MVLSRDNGGKQGWCCDAVTEHVCRPVGPYDGAVGIHVDVMFVHKKGLWNDGKPFVDLDGKILIAAWEQLRQSCVIQRVFKNACRKAFQLFALTSKRTLVHQGDLLCL